MNEEKQLLIETCHSNPILALVTYQIVKLNPGGGWMRVRREALTSSTGLSVKRTKAGVEWLIRKGLLRFTVDGPYPQPTGRYALDEDLLEAFRQTTILRQGSVARRILSSVELRREYYPMDPVVFRYKDMVGDARGNPVRLEDARRLRDDLHAYLELADEMGETLFNKHQESRRVLLSFGGWDGLTTLPPRACDCEDCAGDYDRAFTAMTNSRSHSRQEEKIIRDAMKEIE
jgi:hypothetical protein